MIAILSRLTSTFRSRSMNVLITLGKFSTTHIYEDFLKLRPSIESNFKSLRNCFSSAIRMRTLLFHLKLLLKHPLGILWP